jgi:hypothetical protein
MVETSCCAQGSVFPEILNTELRELFGRVFDEIAKDGFVVVADQNDFPDIVNLGERFEAMVDDGVTGDFKERLVAVEVTVR